MTHAQSIDLESLCRDLDELRARVAAQVGDEDRAHIKKVRMFARAFEVSGRLLIHVSFEPVGFGLGVLGLSLYKILENMEIGHNVLHGQYDFMADPTLSSETYEWDFAATARAWKRAHNVTHHVYTNVIGKDDDFGYTAFRFASDVPYRPLHFFQPLVSPLSGLFFDHAIGVYDMRRSQYAKRKPDGSTFTDYKAMASDVRAFVATAARSYGKEYVFYPLLAGPFAPKVLAGNLLANAVRNLWAYAVIYCGHLTEDVHTFSEEEQARESRGGFYLRQIMGSSNFEAGPILGALSGHLSHQIEHHLFPDIPAFRYRAMSAEVRRICEKHGVPYNNGSFGAQLRSTFRGLFKHAVPKALAPRANRAGKAAKATKAQTPEAALSAVAV
jgi:fatty acid desaturase